MSVSATHHSDAFIQLYMYIHILFHIIFFYGLSQDIEYSSLCCIVGPYCFIKKSLSLHMSSFSLSKYLEMQLLSHVKVYIEL